MYKKVEIMSSGETTSVSRGIFVYKNRSKIPRKKLKRRFSENLWYQKLTELWASINRNFKKIKTKMYSKLTTDLIKYLDNSYRNVEYEIPTAALLTGINMPDHCAQFKNLQNEIQRLVTPYVAVLNNQECGNLKNLMENMINQFFSNSIIEIDDNDENDETLLKRDLKKSNINMALLESWYNNLTEKQLLVVIIPDFESFNIKVLQNFISIISNYLNKLKFVFIFGIATTITTLHTGFPYHITSKMNIQIFECEPSITLLNNMLENFLFIETCPFHLGGNVFDLFTEIFLYYDFSIRNFTKNIKLAMLEHFCFGNAMALCQSDKNDIKEILNCFKHEDFENVRHLMSFRKLVESETHENRIKLLIDDEYLQHIIYKKIVIILKYIKRLKIFLKCLHALVEDLPGVPLGKNLREIYVFTLKNSLSNSHEYKEAFQLLEFQSKDELKIKLEKIVQIIIEIINIRSTKTQLKDFVNQVKTFIKDLDNLEKQTIEESPDVEDAVKDSTNLTGIKNRRALKEALIGKAAQSNSRKHLNRYEILRKSILNYLTEQFKIYLIQPNTMVFYEIFFFDDISIKDKIIGIHRSAIHTALNDPHHYLECNCCKISNNSTIKTTMPDISIAFKLHLEWGKMINLYDWLLAFLCVVDPNENDNLDDKTKKIVRPELQARFTQAVAELEYLGFIKASKRKVDHVARLTWGG